jgi:hypothetical protein
MNEVILFVTFPKTWIINFPLLVVGVTCILPPAEFTKMLSGTSFPVERTAEY